MAEPAGARVDDYPLLFEGPERRVRAEVAGEVVADSHRTLVLHEARLPPVHYFPREDVRLDLLRPTTHRTFCPFKGYASYWSLTVGATRLDNVVWSYEQPYPEAAPLRGMMAFYADRLDRWLEDDHELAVLPTASESPYANPLLGWLLEEAPRIADPAALTLALARQMRATGTPLLRLSVLLRTLHPQLLGLSFRWFRDRDTVEERRVPYSTLHSPQYLNSPVAAIYQGAGGIRRRLDTPDAPLDFGILVDIKAEGGTDYVALPLVFSDGQTHVISLATDRPGGFSTRELGELYEVLGVLARLYEVHALRYTSLTLLDTYLGRQSGARVLAGQIRRGDGDDINAVIWFCDLRESTRLAGSMSRGDFLRTLDTFFDCMAGAVLDHGGEVLRYIGDAALAIFPFPGGDEAAADSICANALAAAQEACRRIAALNDARRERGEPALGFGIGLHLGEVTYGNIGTEQRLEFTVIGDAANRTARIEGLCREVDRPVLASAEFASRFPAQFEPAGRFPMRGVEGRHEVFALRAVA